MKTLLLALLLCAACNSAERADSHVAAANDLTKQCSRARLARWDVRASAAGRDCEVLLVETSIVLDDALVEALHYGASAYDVPEGGVQRYFREHGFRGVTYRDSYRRAWSYGAVSAEEEKELPPCE